MYCLLCPTQSAGKISSYNENQREEREEGRNGEESTETEEKRIHDAKKDLEDLSLAQQREERARQEAHAEAQQMKEAERRARETQQRTEAAVQEQLGKAMELIRNQVQDLDRARAEDAEELRRKEAERKRKIDEDKQLRDREERQARWRMEELEQKQKRSQEDAVRLEEELRRAREGEIRRKEEDMRRELEWKAEKRQMEWQKDWQAARLVEESELLRPTESVHAGGRSRSNSRVRQQIMNAVVAAQDSDPDFIVASDHRPRTSQRERPWSAGAVRHRRCKGTWEDAEDAVERLADHVGRSGVAAGFGLGSDSYHQNLKARNTKRSGPDSRSSTRPSSTVPPSHRSLAEEVAADLDGMPPGEPHGSSSPESGDDGDAPTSRNGRSRHRNQAEKPRSLSSGASYRQVANHSTRWYDLQRAKQRDRKAGALYDAQVEGGVPMTVTLEEVCRSYPQVQKILQLNRADGADSIKLQ